MNLKELVNAKLTEAGIENLKEFVNTKLTEAGIEIAIYENPICEPEVMIDTTKHDEKFRADERKEIIKWIVGNVPMDCYGCCGTKCFQDRTTDCATELLRCYEEEQNDENKG